MGFDTIEINLVEVLKCIENEILKVDMYKAWSVKRWKLAVHEEQKGDVVNSIEKSYSHQLFLHLNMGK